MHHPLMPFVVAVPVAEGLVGLAGPVAAAAAAAVWWASRFPATPFPWHRERGSPANTARRRCRQAQQRGNAPVYMNHSGP